MSDDRKRLFISIGAALMLHIVILILTGMNRPDYVTTREFGPINVEISLDKSELTKPPEPEVEQIRQMDTEEAPPAEVVDKPVQAAEPVPEPVPAVKPSTASKPATIPKSYAPAAVDNSFIEALKQRSNPGGIDAQEVFGDNPVPSSTDTQQPFTAAGSEVFLSDSKPAAEKIEKPETAEPSDMSVIESGDLSALDKRLSTGTAANSNTETSSSATNTSRAAVASSEVSGQSRSLKFDNPAFSRKLLSWVPPKIPPEVQRAGIAKYTVIIEFDIDAEGNVGAPLIRQSSTSPQIDAAVQQALREWGFERSSSADNKKVRATLTYVIEIK